MRATLRITWMLLLLGSFSPSVHPQNTTTILNSSDNTTTVETSLEPVLIPPAATTEIQKPTEKTYTPETSTPAAVIPTTKPNVEPTNPTTVNHKLTTVLSSPTPETTKLEETTLQAVTATNGQTKPADTTLLTVAASATDTAAIPTQVTTAVGVTGLVSVDSTTEKTQAVDATSKAQDLDSDVLNSTAVTPGLSLTAHTTTRNVISINPFTSQTDGIKATIPMATHGSTSSKDLKPSPTPGIAITTAIPPEAGTTIVVPLIPEAESTLPPTATTFRPSTQLLNFTYSLNNGEESHEEKEMVELCKRVMSDWQSGMCVLQYQKHNNEVNFVKVEIKGHVKNILAKQYYKEITKNPTDNKTLIAILASCGALLIMIVILAVCASHHRRPYNENQQHLTEELNTVENGYHDNPTLEVMEVQPEMQEKKMALNGEFNDSWIVPIDNLMKDDIPDEEDTHL